MAQKVFMKNQNLIIAIIVSTILGLSILGYGFLNYKSRQENIAFEKEKIEMEQEKLAQEKKEIKCGLLNRWLCLT